MSSRENMEDDLDPMAPYKNKLLKFRLVELKDILTQVGLSKQGKKQDLTDRILALLYDEGSVFKKYVNWKQDLLAIIDVAHRNMQSEMAGNSNAKKPKISSSSRLRIKEEVDESSQLARKIQCPCGTDSPNTQMVQCSDPSCNVWQHIRCVIIPENPLENIAMPTKFLCEICRLNRADPFWATMAHPLQSVKIVTSGIAVDGTNPSAIVDTTFKLTRADRDLLQNSDCGLQVWCMLLNDSVPFRIQWPLYTNLHVNGSQLKTVSRPGSQQLGAHGRDDGAKITSDIIESINKVTLTFADARTFCFGVRLVRRRTLEQVFGMIPKESDGELFEDALVRVQRCIGGGIATGNDDSDSDLEMIADSVSVSLRCPMSGSRMKTAGRFRACAHMGCFDLETFVGINERTRKWQCPICLKNFSLEDIIIDPFFNRILNMIGSCGEEINEIDVKAVGQWRVKKARDAGDLSKWHNSDGSVEVLSEAGTGREHVWDMKSNGVAQPSDVPQGQHIDPRNDEDENHELNIITMSSTTTDYGKDGGDPSINQDGDELVDVYNSTDLEVNSGANQVHQTQEINIDADIIVLSDSEDDDLSLIYPESVSVVGTSVIEGPCASVHDENVNFVAADTPTESPGPFYGNADSLVSRPPFPHSSLGGSLSENYGTSGALTDENNNLSTLESAVDLLPHMMDLFDQHKSSSSYQLPSANGNTSAEALSCPPVFRDDLPVVNSSFDEHQNISITGGNVHESASINGEALCDSAIAEDSSIQRAQGDSAPRPGSGSGSDLNDNNKRPGDPFSFPRQQRSSRPWVNRAGSSNTQ